MTPFTKAAHDPLLPIVNRNVLLSQPPEMFKPFFNGRIPSLQEKIQFVEIAVQRMTSFNVYMNDTYRVEVMPHGPFIHLDIRRHDAGPCTNWKDFQQIKNELVGPEHEAVELFPAESRLVDAGNQYHLWVHRDPTFRFQLGFEQRYVLDRPLTMQDPTARVVEYTPALPLDGAAKNTAAPQFR